MKDIECPYCNHSQYVDHDDDYDYEEDVLHNMMCEKCDKYFAYQTSVIYYYYPSKADCLNDGEHQWDTQSTFPTKWSNIECKLCGEVRKPTEDEWKTITKDKQYLTIKNNIAI